jgi:hypothetical protein
MRRVGTLDPDRWQQTGTLCSWMWFCVTGRWIEPVNFIPLAGEKPQQHSKRLERDLEHYRRQRETLKAT